MMRPIPFLLVAVALSAGCKEEEEKARPPINMSGVGDDSSVVPVGDTTEGVETEGPSTTGGGASGGTTGSGDATAGPQTAGPQTAGDTAGAETTGDHNTSDDGPSLTTDEPPPE